MPEEFPIKIEVLIGFKEYLRLVFVLALKKLGPLVLIIFVSVIYVCYVNGNTGAQKNWPFIIIVSFIVTIALLAFSVYRAAKKTFKNTPALRERTRYSFSAERIEITGDSFNTNINWNLITKAKEMGNVFLLFPGPATAFYVPKRSFRDEDQIREFRNLLRQQLGDKAKIKK